MRHEHEWTETDSETPSEHWACTSCPATSDTCGTCGRASGTSLLICERCLAREDQVLHDIEHAIRQHRSAPPSPVRAARYDREPVQGTGVGEVRPDRISTVTDVVEVLTSWADAWRDASGDDRGEGPLDYLRGHLLWAAHHPDASGWTDYRREVGQLRHAARRLSGLLPERQPEPCPHCGGQVVRDWSDETWTANPHGLDDVTRCTGCAMTWGSRERFTFVARHHVQALPAADPDFLVTLAEARAVFPSVPRGTMTSWVSRDEDLDEDERQVPRRGWSVRGEPLYRVGDLAALVERRSSATRRGRPAARRTSGVA